MIDKFARMESLWLDPDYDWATGEYDDSWGEPPHKRESVYDFVRKEMEWFKQTVCNDVFYFTPYEFLDWLYESYKDDHIAMNYDETELKHAVIEIWECESDWEDE